MDSETVSEEKILKLTVIKGTNLAKKDIFGASDPYVKIFVADKLTSYIHKTIQTKTIKKTLNPVWDETFYIKVDPEKSKLLLEVFDENRLTRDDFLGQVTLDLSWMNEPPPSPESAYHLRQPRSITLMPRSSKSRVRGALHIAFDGPIDPSDLEHDFGFYEWQRTDSAPLGSSLVSGSPWVRRLPHSGSSSREGRLPRDDNGYSSEGRSAEDGAQDTLAEESAVEVREEEQGGEEEVEEVAEEDAPEEPQAETTEEAPEHNEEANENTVSNNDNNAENTTSLSHLSLQTPCSSNYHGTHWQDQLMLPALPEGWEERVDANGRTYYVNHLTRTSSWLHPTVLRQTQSSSSTSSTPSPSHLLPGDLHTETPKSGNRHIVTREDALERLSLTSEDEEATEMPRNASNALIAISMVESMDEPGESRNEEDEEEADEGNNNETESRALFRVLDDEGEEEEDEEEGAHGDDDNEEELPAGWAMSTAPNGRTFYIDHNNQITTWDDPRKKKTNDDNDPHNLGPLPLGWEERIHTDGRVFYVDHFNKRTQWDDPRLNKLGGPAIKYSMGYKRKYDTFMMKLAKVNSSLGNKKLELVVSRENIFEDSYRLISSCEPTQLKYKLWVEFEGELGLDYGGISKEWMNLLSKEMFNPYYGLFEYSAIDDYTLQINPNSGLANEHHLSYFKFIGRVCAMAVYHGNLIDAYFIRPFYKMMLDRHITLKDMESVDSEYYNSMVWMLENDPEVLELTFSVDEDVFGEMSEIELIPDGKSIKVTNENKVQYIDQVIRWRFINRVRKQMNHLMKGFFEIIPKQLISIFDPNEMELLLAGLQDIDVNDWKSNTKYKGDYNPNHPVIIHFWKVVYLLNNEQRSRLLQFVTGTSRVPMNGFSQLYGSNGHQAFTVTKWGNPNQLPRAHTCFNRLDLPPYSTFDEMKRKILFAIQNSDCFDGVD